jgi:hypothetical protein
MFYSCTDFITSYHRRVFIVSNPQLNEELQEALCNLGSGADKAGSLGVLRVLCSFPAEPHTATLTKLAQADKCNYVATMNIKRLAKDHTEKEVIRAMEIRLTAALAAASQQRKRKSENDELRCTKRKT